MLTYPLKKIRESFAIKTYPLYGILQVKLSINTQQIITLRSCDARLILVY